jgi:hypothetical protein
MPTPQDLRKKPANPRIPSLLFEIGFVCQKKHFHARKAQSRTTLPNQPPPDSRFICVHPRPSAANTSFANSAPAPSRPKRLRLPKKEFHSQAAQPRTKELTHPFGIRIASIAEPLRNRRQNRLRQRHFTQGWGK